MCNIYLALEKYDKAEAAFLSALQYDPNCAEAKNDLAILYLKSAKKLEDVENTIRTSIDAKALIQHNTASAQKEKLKNQFMTQLKMMKNDSVGLDGKKIVGIENQIENSYSK